MTAQQSDGMPPPFEAMPEYYFGRDLMTPDEAAAYLGKKPAELKVLAQRFGIGRRNQPVEGKQWVYAKVDLDRIKLSLADEAREPPEPSTPAATS